MSLLRTPRVPRTASSGLCSPSARQRRPDSERRLRDEGHRGAQRPPKAAEHRPVVHRLRRRDRGVGIAHRAAAAIMPPLMHEVRLHAEERRLPQHEVGELALLDRADLWEMPWAIAGLIVYLAM
jgi:hypothetical protein